MKHAKGCGWPTVAWKPVLAVLALAAGCATVDPRPDYARTRELIEQSTGIGESCDPEQDGLSPEEIDAYLADGLTLGEAVQLALLNNRRLQAAFLDIGIARADWVQSGLLSNPSLGIGLLFPEGGGRSNLQANLAQNVVDLWQIPVKKRAAGHQLESRILQVARLAGELVAETQRAYYQALATRELLAIAEQNLALLARSYEAIRVKREAGAASPLDENLQRGELLAAELVLRDTRLAAANAKRALARLLSLDLNVDELELSGSFPAQAGIDFDADELIAAAREKRLDLRSLAQSVLAGEAEIELAYLRIFPEVSLGLGAERNERRALPGRNVAAATARASLQAGQLAAPDLQSRGERDEARRQQIDLIWGPTATVTLPVFDQNQAQIAKARYTQWQAVKSYEDLYLNIAQDIRIAVDRASTLWSNVEFYHDDVLPQAEKNLNFTDAAYQAGSVDILTLLESQRFLLEARRGSILASSDATASLSDLERAVGVPLRGM